MITRIRLMAGGVSHWLFGGIGRIHHQRWEILLMRMGLAWLVFGSTPTTILPVAKAQFKPHGIAQFIDITFISQPGVYSLAHWIFLVTLVCYALGLEVGFCLGYMLAFVVLISTLGLSQGFVGHAGQMEGLILLAQFAAVAWANALQQGRIGIPSNLRRSRDDLMMCWSRQAIVATYVVAGLTKLINSNGEWLGRSGNFVLQVLKSQSETYYSTGVHANPASMAFLSKLNQWPSLAVAFLAAGLLLELGAFLAAWNRALGLVIGLMLIGFHVSLGTLMYLPFFESRNYVMLFLVNSVWWGLIAFRFARGQFCTGARARRSGEHPLSFPRAPPRTAGQLLVSRRLARPTDTGSTWLRERRQAPR